MFGFGKSKERLEIEKDVKILRDHGVEIRVVGRGTLYVDAKNLDKIKEFRERADRVRELFK